MAKENTSVLKGSLWGSPSCVMARWLRYGLMTSTGCASKTLTASSPVLWTKFSENLHAGVAEPNAFLKSKQATTCVGLSANGLSKLWSSPVPLGGSDAKLSISEKDFQVGLGRL